LFLALVSAIAPDLPAIADEHEIHVCQDESGNTVFQSYPCPIASEKNAAPSTSSTKRPSRTVPASSPEPSPPQSPAAVSKRRIAPVPPREQPPAPSRSRQAKPTPSNPTQPPLRRGTWVKVPPLQGAPSSPGRSLGKQSFPTSLAGVALPVSPSFRSPEQTWRTFLVAIENGDRTSAVACLTPTALESLGTDADSFFLEDVRTLVGTFVRIEDEGDLGPFWSIYGVRVKQRPKWILFERIETGEWKIAGI
jgi:hypothetical protein